MAAASLSLAATWAGPALADPAHDDGVLTLQAENSSVSIGGVADKFYVNGLRLGWTTPEGGGPSFLAAADRAVWGEGETRTEFSLDQQIYTPADTALATPDPNDRPYAGVLIGDLALIDDTDETRSVLQLSLGLVGPDAGGEQLQNGFHSIAGQPRVDGWSHQIGDTPVVNLLAERIWRSSPMQLGALEADVLPSLTGAAGDLRDYLQGGVVLRLGQGLDSDFGPPRLRPGLSGGDAFARTRPLAWYLFAGADGQVVAYDLLLQSSPFRSGPRVAPDRGVGELQMGLAMLFGRARLSFAYVAQSPEFRGQIGGLHQFMSAAIALRL